MGKRFGGPRGSKGPWLCNCSFPSEPPFAFAPLLDTAGSQASETAGEEGSGRKAAARPALPRLTHPKSPGLCLQHRARPTLASPGQGSAQVHATSHARPEPGRLSPAPAAASGPPPAGMGVGPGGHRLADSGSGGESEPHPLRQPRTYLQGKRGSWTAATGLRAGADAAGARPRDPRCPRWGRRGRDARGLPRASAACRRGRGDLALPLAPGHRRRHFAFHSVSPPPHSAAGFPDVGISRRRLRGGRGLGASGRPAAGSERPAWGLRATAGGPLPRATVNGAPRRSRVPPQGWRVRGRGSGPSPARAHSVCSVPAFARRGEPATRGHHEGLDSPEGTLKLRRGRRHWRSAGL
uniref:Uncharacterized protein n=1 Tax=Oryctolagus cuniculus TaxID=9986 RepID=A0A5F9CQY2_RABIT